MQVQKAPTDLTGIAELAVVFLIFLTAGVPSFNVHQVSTVHYHLAVRSWNLIVTIDAQELDPNALVWSSLKRRAMRSCAQRTATWSKQGHFDRRISEGRRIIVKGGKQQQHQPS